MDVRKVHAPLFPPCSYHIGIAQRQELEPVKPAKLARRFDVAVGHGTFFSFARGA
jgi:hypothetical protein